MTKSGTVINIWATFYHRRLTWRKDCTVYREMKQMDINQTDWIQNGESKTRDCHQARFPKIQITALHHGSTDQDFLIFLVLVRNGPRFYIFYGPRPISDVISDFFSINRARWGSLKIADKGKRVKRKYFLMNFYGMLLITKCILLEAPDRLTNRYVCTFLVPQLHDITGFYKHSGIKRNQWWIRVKCIPEMKDK